MANPGFVGLDLVYHMNFIISTSLIHWVGLVGGSVEVSAVYSSMGHFYRCSVHRCVSPPALFLLIHLIAALISPSIVFS